ncbi:hypothetical protein ARMSODRAFT_564946 [Armillaria solidipes]|uniref:Uncharacterized protein n=1 Tax=Armillaria solidipes TaxID=1076256 RepID=A0A2H3CCR4_9AGAR|nr:hypothetical protein ARMSODRAFT_564946 [Armillaria solidipes]
MRNRRINSVLACSSRSAGSLFRKTRHYRTDRDHSITSLELSSFIRPSTMTHPSIKLPSPLFSSSLPEFPSPPLTTSGPSVTSPEPSSAVSIHQRRGFNFRLTLHLPQRDAVSPHIVPVLPKGHLQPHVSNLPRRTSRKRVQT